MTIFLKVFISAILFVASSFSYAPGRQADCNIYKKGSFVRYMSNRSGLGHWQRAEVYIERNDSIEAHVVQMLAKDTIFYKIQWKTPCRYELHFHKATNTLADSILRYYSKRSVLKCFIVRGTNTYYIEKTGNEIDTIWLRQ